MDSERSSGHERGSFPSPPRTTDRVADAVAWLLGALALFALLGAVVAGTWAHATGLERGRTEWAQRSEVEAVLLEAVPPGLGGPETGTQSLAAVPARYVDRQGIEHVALVVVRGPEAAGARVPVWVDRHGHLGPTPTGPLRALVTGVVVGMAVVLVSGSALVLGWLATGYVLGQLNAAAWAREWEQLEPRWTGRLPG
jgi:hypothetical protein